MVEVVETVEGERNRGTIVKMLRIVARETRQSPIDDPACISVRRSNRILAASCWYLGSPCSGRSAWLISMKGMKPERSS